MLQLSILTLATSVTLDVSADGRGTGRPSVSQQLNISGFTSCLLRRGGDGPHTAPNLTMIHAEYGLHELDGLIEYLAVYAAYRPLRLLNRTQARAFKRWTEPFYPATEQTAEWLYEEAVAARAADRNVLPGALFAAALQNCERGGNHSMATSSLCAAAACHNLLRTLGRMETYIDAAGNDYLPPWFKANAVHWLVGTAVIHDRLAPLRSDRSGDRWGEWYHTFGIVLFGLHEAAIEGAKAGATMTRLFAQLNFVLGRFLGAGAEVCSPSMLSTPTSMPPTVQTEERGSHCITKSSAVQDPRKARLDRDAADVAAAFAAGGPVVDQRHTLNHDLLDSSSMPWTQACREERTYSCPEAVIVRPHFKPHRLVRHR
jgi:hypothetical protein